MMRLWIWSFAILISIVPFLSPAALIATEDTESDEEASLTIGEAVMATGVENLIAVGKGTAFPGTVGKIYCFTRIKGATQNTTIKHLWFKGDQLVMEITLPVRSADWRTYSTKTITPGSTGSWRVAITTSSGTVLQSVPFTVE